MRMLNIVRKNTETVDLSITETVTFFITLINTAAKGNDIYFNRLSIDACR